MMKIYNTLTKKIEKFEPKDKNQVTMYTCGPTVYYYAHIGNLRTYISEDVLEKGLNYIGYNVKRCMNITDVGHLVGDGDTGEDKMMTTAKKEKKSVLEIAEYYTKAFFQDLEKLNIKKPEIISKATDNINEYIKMITKLIDTGYAYESNGNIYFDTEKFEEYYQLSGRNPEELLNAVRNDVTIDEHKKNPLDFGLWFTNSKFQDQELKWDSPWGIGYPGWHIECSGISIKELGEYLDIHCGAIDAIFPHHTNEIAQSEAYLNHKWCSYWVHMEFLNDKNGKMSKSKGDSLDLNYIIKMGYKPLVYRFFCLQSHYRNQLVFSEQGMESAKIAYNKLLRKIKTIKENKEGNLDLKKIEKFREKFKDAFKNDMNTSLMITTIYDVIKSDLNNNSKLYLIEDFDKVLSLDLLKQQEIDADFRKYIEDKIKERNIAKKNKNYELADKIRDELMKKKVIIKDSREGTTFEIEN